MVKVWSIRMNNGLLMPEFGLGTTMGFFQQLYLFGEARKDTEYAIDIGYRHFDTADMNDNEREVGLAIRKKIKEGVVNREDIFVVTKLWNTDHEPEKVRIACQRSCGNLGLEYIDLYLMHSPISFNERTPFDMQNPDAMFDEADVDFLDTWKAMETLVDSGLVKSIGVANFNSKQINRLLANCRIKPVANQIEVSLQFIQKELIKFCHEHDIIVTAVCPMGRPNPAEKKPEILYDAKLMEIGEKYGKTPAQVVFRYLVDIGTVPIPKSITQKGIDENIHIFDFKLTDEEIAYIDTFNTGSGIVHYREARNHKYFPFGVEF